MNTTTIKLKSIETVVKDIAECEAALKKARHFMLSAPAQAHYAQEVSELKKRLQFLRNAHAILQLPNPTNMVALQRDRVNKMLRKCAEMVSDAQRNYMGNNQNVVVAAIRKEFNEPLLKSQKDTIDYLIEQ